MKIIARLVLGLLISSASLLQADTLGVSVVPDQVFVNTGLWTLGYSFLVNTSINVTGLGVYDVNGDGLNVSHAVGIWDSNGNLLASTTVAAGSVAPLDGGFRFSSISTLALTAGSIYFVGSVNGLDDDGWLQDPLSITAASEITYLSRQYQVSGGGLVFPDLVGSGKTGYFGANFEFNAIPEPGTLVRLGSGLIGLAGAVRRRLFS